MTKKESGFFHRFLGEMKPNEPQHSAAASVPGASWPKKATVLSLGLSPKIGECRARYIFKDLEAAFDSNTYEPGVPVTLRSDGSIVIGGEPVGTFSHAQVQAMLRDWHDLGDPVVAHLLQMNQDGTGIIYLAFYAAPVYEKERFCKVFGTERAEKQKALLSLSPGDELYLDESVDIPGCVDVSDIGFLDSKDSAWALDALDFGLCEVTVASVEFDEQEKHVLTVRIRY
ncbi:MAG: hypothetical protein IKO00_16980 [Oscillospiraceae bacterium]|nr:hypothetical protein [Oscillospiraceae bacterium]